ncbi:hypothetical protein ACFLZT_04920 [Thermodesulfobacteriota bacterium]
MLTQIEITVNGEQKKATVSPETTLLDLLRNNFGLTGTKNRGNGNNIMLLNIFILPLIHLGYLIPRPGDKKV